MSRILSLAIAVALIVTSAVVHGRWTNRWGKSAETRNAVARLDRVAIDLGDWHAESRRMGPTEMYQADIEGGLLRRYKNQKDGSEISVLLVCGRPGPVSVHTPEVCYGGSGYESEADPLKFPITPEGSTRAAEFRLERFQKPRSAVPVHLNILWSFHAKGRWCQPDDPRSALATEPFIYKLYVVHEARSADPPAQDDPCVAFVRRDLLPELQRSLFPEG
jgi:hypothetical protein